MQVCVVERNLSLSMILIKSHFYSNQIYNSQLRNEYMTGSDHFSAFKYENIIIECNELI